MPFEKRIRQLAAKIEAVEGAAEALAAADANLLVFDVVSEPLKVDMYDRNVNRGTLSKLAPIAGVTPWKMAFKVELRGSGTKDVAPSIGKLLRACGFAETVTPATSVVYDPASAAIPSMTMGVYQGGIIEKMKGARGNMKLSAKTLQPGILEFEFHGVFDSQTDGANLANVTYEPTIPPRFDNVALIIDSPNWGAANINFTSFSFDMGNQLALRESANVAGGLIAARITGRDPKGSIDPEKVLKATYDVLGKLQGATPVPLQMTIGSVVGNKFDITAPKAVFTSHGDQDRDGISIVGLNLAFGMDSGDDEIKLKQY